MSREDVEKLVCEDIFCRQLAGIKKYGKTLAENELPLRSWLEHAYQECLDQALYLRRAMQAIDEDMDTVGRIPPAMEDAKRNGWFE
jgi:hypothetical protein